MRMRICATLPAGLHCTSRRAAGSLKLLRWYSSEMRRSMPGTVMDLPHYSLHHGMETLLLCSYCWTTMRIHMCTTTEEALHWVRQRVTGALRFVGYYSSST